MTEQTSGAAVRRPTWMVATIAGAFGLLYAYAVWAGISQLVMSLQGGVALSAMAWIVWGLAIVLPILAFALAVSFGHSRGLGTLTLLLLVGLCIVAVYWLDALAYVTRPGM